MTRSRQGGIQQKSLAPYERAAADRDSAIRAAYASGTHTLTAIGGHFGLHYATISRLHGRECGRTRCDPMLLFWKDSCW